MNPSSAAVGLVGRVYTRERNAALAGERAVRRFASTSIAALGAARAGQSDATGLRNDRRYARSRTPALVASRWIAVFTRGAMCAGVSRASFASRDATMAEDDVQ